jgi:RNA polymerase sigma-32 factor
MSLVLVASTSLPFPVAHVGVGGAESYILTVERFPLLSAEEESGLARKLRSDGDIDSARKLILSHLRMVVSIARGFAGYGLLQEDLIQEGNVGLMKAVRKFDPDRGVRLASYAVHWIRSEIQEFILRNWRLVKIASSKAQRKLFFNLRSMKPGLRTLSQTEVRNISKVLRVKPEEVIQMECRFAGKDVALEPDSNADERYAPIDYLAQPHAEPSQVIELEQNERLGSEGLASALASLDARSQRIIEARWLCEKGRSTLNALAAEFKVSAERIRQIEVIALRTMRNVLMTA